MSRGRKEATVESGIVLHETVVQQELASKCRELAPSLRLISFSTSLINQNINARSVMAIGP